MASFNISDPDSQASFAGTQSIGRGVQAPSQAGLLGLNYLANAQQKSAADQYLEQLGQSNALRTMLARGDMANDRAADTQSALASLTENQAPAAAEQIVTLGAGMQPGQLSRTLNMQGGGNIVNQQQAETESTRAQALDRGENAAAYVTGDTPINLSQPLRSLLQQPERQADLDAQVQAAAEPVEEKRQFFDDQGNQVTLSGTPQQIEAEARRRSLSPSQGGTPYSGGPASAPSGIQPGQQQVLQRLDELTTSGELGYVANTSAAQARPDGTMAVPIQNHPTMGDANIIYGTDGRPLRVEDNQGNVVQELMEQR